MNFLFAARQIARTTIARTSLVLGLCAPALFAMSAAKADTLNIKYSVHFSVLPIGNAFLSGSVSPAAYSVEASVKLSGLASMVSSSKGVATAAGAFAGGKLVPQSYATTAANSKQTRTIRMAISGGNVSGLEINPPFDEAPNRVPITDASKRGIFDPLGGILMPYTGDFGEGVCNRTLPVFDGGARFNIALSYSGTKQVKAKGYSGPVMVCSARYTPVAGHRPDKPATKFMADNRDLEVWMAPVGQTHVAAPYKISVKTMTGTAVIEATEFSDTP